MRMGFIRLQCEKHIQPLDGRTLTMDDSLDPRIIMFACNWCAYSAADLAGVSRMQYPPDIRLIRIMCTGRMNPNFILKAYQLGADGVLVSG